MIDPWPKTWLKRALAAVWLFELRLRRAFARRREPARWAISGTCACCGGCCVEPSIRVGRLTWFLPTLRALFLWWQQRVNGMELLRTERQLKIFVFSCSHYDRATKRCDSYDSRPGMCRDYPRLMEEHAWPQLLENCSYGVRALGQEGLRASIDATDLPEEKKAELRRKLRLE
ncbi:MAG: hypothetical protein QM765_38010 [Myxococcales bacterium]